MKRTRGTNNERDQRFAENLAAGMSQHEAYLEAGFRGSQGNASRKANTPEIRIKVDKIHDLYLSNLIVDQAWVKREQVKTYFRAVDARDHHVCQKLLKDIGVDLGLGVRRAEVNIHHAYERKTDLELLHELSEVLAQAEQQLALADQSNQEESDDHTQ